MWWPTNRPAPETVTLPGLSLAQAARSFTELNLLFLLTTRTAGSAPQLAIGSRLSMLYLVLNLIDWAMKCGTL